MGSTSRSNGLLLPRIDWDLLREQIRKEIAAREDVLPVVSAYRWWARRPGRLFGAILDAAGPVRVADPFGGGGTIAVEAARRGLPAYVQDLYPWPIFGMATAFTPVAPERLVEAGRKLLSALEPLRQPYIRPDGRELTHVLRVRLGRCPGCGKELALFPDPLVSLASRRAGETQAYYGCAACGEIWLGPRAHVPLHCPTCRRPLSIRSARDRLRCPLCERSDSAGAFLEAPPRWRPVLVQEVVPGPRPRVILRPVDPADPVNARPASEVFPELREPIPPGQETNRLRNAGFQTWGDLYTERQAAVLLEGLRALAETESPIRDHLALALLGAAEMPAFLTRWDRYHPKAIEAMAHHRYAHTLLAVETNLLSPVGRGTLPRRLRALQGMAEWVRRELRVDSLPRLLPDLSERVHPESGVYLALGSSVRMALKDGAVDLVLTDPPYHDDVQYGELARLFHFWLRRYRPLPDIDEGEEAVPNRARNGRGGYAEILERCFLECRRVLRPGGRLVFTFRNRELRAWQTLCVALGRAGFRIHAIVVLRTDELRDPTRKGSRSLRHDLILECAGPEVPAPVWPFVYAGRSSEERALLAAGLAMAEALRKGQSERLPEVFHKWRRRLGLREGTWIR